ncbi:MAG: 4-methyl-5(b-hydroxyethyl)-thiazole monophosphate biosynthesis [Lentisphaeria bacterium]|jgi:4-methyl-5(b-hydroxyethyl)-thiazole monophosphate biosynthesis
MPGADNLAKDERVLDLLRRAVDARVPIAAICAAPRALVATGITGRKRISCYPGALGDLDTSDTQICDDAVCEDLPLITSLNVTYFSKDF